MLVTIITNLYYNLLGVCFLVYIIDMYLLVGALFGIVIHCVTIMIAFGLPTAMQFNQEFLQTKGNLFKRSFWHQGGRAKKIMKVQIMYTYNEN